MNIRNLFGRLLLLGVAIVLGYFSAMNWLYGNIWAATFTGALAVAWTALALLPRRRHLLNEETYIEYTDPSGFRVVYPTYRLNGPRINSLIEHRDGEIVTEAELKRRQKQQSKDHHDMKQWLKQL